LSTSRRRRWFHPVHDICPGFAALSRCLEISPEFDRIKNVHLSISIPIFLQKAGSASNLKPTISPCLDNLNSQAALIIDV